MSQSGKTILYVDVSHTWGTDLQTGMQKVVRQLSAVWSNAEYDCRPVIYQGGHYRVLPKNSFSDILSTYSERNPKPLLRKNIWKISKPIYRKILSKVSLNARVGILTSTPARKIHKFLNGIPAGENTEILNPEGINLLILEVNFDLDHLNYIFYIASKRNSKLTFFSYDLIPINHQQYCPPEFTVMFRRYLEISRYSEKLWSISNTTRKELEEYVGDSQYLRKSTFKWLPPSNYPRCNHALPFEISPEDSSYWLFVSSFEPRKNHLGFFEALKILKVEGIKLPMIVLVGGSTWDDYGITQGIKELISEGFDLVKLVNINECCVGKLYASAGLTVYPSHFEGFGLPVVESLSFGIPVITSDCGSTGELLQLLGTLGFRQGDSHDLARKLKSLLQDKTAQKNLTINAESAKADFGTWIEYANEIFYFATERLENLD